MSLGHNPIEDQLVSELDNKMIAEEFLPAIKMIIKAGGGAEAILKSSEAMAACRLSQAALYGRGDIALKAATEILNRTQGRPVERRLNIYADVAEMSEDQLEREIYALAKRVGVKEEVIDILAEGTKAKKKVLAAPAARTTLSTNLDPNRKSVKKAKVDASKQDG